MVENIIFHIDVNSAFLSWSACDLLMRDVTATDYRTVPAVIGGNQSTRHGIVLAKSLPAKKYGIITGEPLVDAKSKYPNLIVLPADYELYVRCSDSLMKLLMKFTPNVEQYSIDEAFCDFSGFEKLYGTPVTFAHELKDMIKAELGFTVNIGISSNKLLAKMASDFKKPDMVHTLFPWEIQEKMWPLAVGDLFFVGKITENRLKAFGINTIKELANTDMAWLCSIFNSYGRVLWNYANGFDIEIPTDEHAPNKGYGNSMTIKYDVTDIPTANHYLLSLSEIVGMRLRADHVAVGVIAVSIVTCEFKRSTHQMTFLSPTNITSRIWDTACRLFAELWDKTPIRQLGIHTHRVCPEDNYQYTLFDMDNYDKYRSLDTAIDEIKARFGDTAVQRACFINDERQQCHPRFM